MDETNDDLLDRLIGLARSNLPASDDQPRTLERKARAAVLSRMRPRPKLDTDITPEIVAMLDSSAAREDEARWIAGKVIEMRCAEVMAKVNHVPSAEEMVKAVSIVLNFARRQVAEAQTKG